MKKITQYAPSILFLGFVAVLSVLFLMMPKTTYSDNEKRFLAETPELSTDRLLDGSLMTDFETYLSDHFPGRDLFVGVNAYYELLTGRGGTADVYMGSDGYLIGAESTTATVENVKMNMINFSAFAQEAGLNATAMIVPSTGYILDDKLPTLHADYHDAEFLDAAKAAADMTWIDLTARFNAVKNDVPLYYKTDHHLTADGSYELYKAFLETQGIAPRTDFEKETHGGFYGTYYSRSGYWLSEPDKVTLWTIPGMTVTVEISDGLGEPAVSDSLFYRGHLNEPDHYPVYLDGNHGFTKITNPNADGGKLLIIKDSFAHCVTTMLAAHYSEIYMIDLRYYNGDAVQSVADIVAENDIRDALFLYGVDSLSTDSSSSFKLFFDLETAIPTSY